MHPAFQQSREGLTRRGFLIGAGAGLVVGAPLTWLGLKALQAMRVENGQRPLLQTANHQYGMPGPFPGRVIEVYHPEAVREDHSIRAEPVQAMMNRGMCELTGVDHAVEAWRQFFVPGDVVGIKVNPVGRKRKPSDVGAISSPAVLLEVVEGLKSAGVKARDMIVFERYADDFREAGYEAVLRERSMDGVRWYASSARYTDSQLDIAGYDLPSEQRNRDSHVVGYDPNVFISMGYAMPKPYHDPKDDRCFRSHLTVIVTRMINKLVTIPVLKDHRSAGVTLALKNLSHGLNNNVARSHIPSVLRLSGRVSAPNQCNTFIPTAAGQSPIRQKAVLHILDGLIGVYEGGPGSWNKTWGTWRHKSLFFATDPVALDLVGWEIIDAKRAQEGWQPVAQMGALYHRPAMATAGRLNGLVPPHILGAAASALLGENCPGNQETEPCDRRQPEHILLAGTLGLGVFDARGIDHRRIHLSAWGRSPVRQV
jgi:uncharacterized protein (DUF362 family)